MRCVRCKASYEVHYAESYECDWYCNAGVPEDEMIEFDDGEWGCRLHYKTIEKKLKVNEKAWIRDKEQWVKWYEENEIKEGPKNEGSQV